MSTSRSKRSYTPWYTLVALRIRFYTMRSKRKNPYHKHGAHRLTLRLRAFTPRLRPVVFYSRHHRAHQREMRLPMRATMP